MNLLDNSAVQRLRDSIVLGGVMPVSGEAAFGSLRLQESSELAAGVLPSAVRPQPFNNDSMLGLSPHCKSLVRSERFVLGLK
jgi:hypothetical protein